MSRIRREGLCALKPRTLIFSQKKKNLILHCPLFFWVRLGEVGLHVWLVFPSCFAPLCLLLPCLFSLVLRSTCRSRDVVRSLGATRSRRLPKRTTAFLRIENREMNGIVDAFLSESCARFLETAARLNVWCAKTLGTTALLGVFAPFPLGPTRWWGGLSLSLSPLFSLPLSLSLSLFSRFSFCSSACMTFCPGRSPLFPLPPFALQWRPVLNQRQKNLGKRVAPRRGNPIVEFLTR